MNLVRPRVLQEVAKFLGFIRRRVDARIARIRAGFRSKSSRLATRIQAPGNPPCRQKTTRSPTRRRAAQISNSTRPAPSGSPDNVPAAYRIGVDDQIQISVWREHDLSLSVVVRPDGMITLPLLNDISVVGMTPKELSDSLTEKLKPFVNEPQVTVSVQAIHSRKVYLIGNASRPGVFDLNDNKTAMELIAEAGGLSQFAKTNSIYILRTVNGSDTRIPFHYKDAVNGKSPDVLLMPGDKVVVP